MTTATTIKQPTPAEIRAAREEAGLSRREAAELVHAYDLTGRGSYRTWQNWELEASSPDAHPIPLAAWELFLLKTKEKRRRK